MDLEKEKIFPPEAHTYKILKARARFITTFKGKATLLPNTSVSEVSVPRFARDLRRRKVGISDKIQPEDKIILSRPYIPYTETEEVLWQKETPSTDPLVPTTPFHNRNFQYIRQGGIFISKGDTACRATGTRINYNA